MSSKSRGNKTGRPSKAIFHKDLVIIPNPNANQVPSHVNRVKLEERGLIIHQLPFNRDWSYLGLKRNTESQLPREDIMFEYLKACYGTLVTPKLAKGVRMDGERIIKLSGQGTVYIRCLEPFEEIDRDEDDEELMIPSFTQFTGDLSENLVDGSSSSLQHQNSEAVSTDPGELLMTEDPMPYLPEMENNESVNNYEVVVDVNEIFPPTSPSNNGEVPTKVIRVHRSNVRADMLDIFSDPFIFKSSLNAIIINQLGHEEAGQGNGVLREAFALFWKEFYESHMLGETERVPYIRQDFDRNKWEAVGRILVKGYTESQYFPFKLSKAFLAGCIFGEGSITPEMLQDSFKCYVSPSATSLIEGCLANSIACDSDEMLDFLSAFDCKRKVTHSNFVEIMREVAHKEIVQKPKYVSDCWQPILAHLKIYFSDVKSLHQFYSSIMPSNVKVIGPLEASPATAAETETLAHLERFIRGLDQAKLTSF